jgi:nucleoside-diphosphate-sugar epimerase
MERKCRRAHNAQQRGGIVMKVLVTGSTGRVGSRFVPRLLRQEQEVSLLVRNEAKAEHFKAKGAQVVVGDLGDPSTLKRALQGAAVVVHPAAEFRTQDEAAISSTIESGTVALANASRTTGVQRFVFASTHLVYGDHDYGHPAREIDEQHPGAAYPVSKVAAERYLLGLRERQQLDVLILRFAFVYGEGDPHLDESVPLLQRWHWHPAQRLHMVHHADVGQALLLATHLPSVSDGLYNVADDAPASAEELMRLTGKQGELVAAEPGLKNPWNGLVDTSKIRRELGFRPLVPSVYSALDLGIL